MFGLGGIEHYKVDIPDSWTKLNLEALEGVVIIIGAPDSGKSTFARYLYRRLSQQNRKVAYLDGDPGQSSLGLPSTITIGLGAGEGDVFPPSGPYWSRFIGSVSPRGHMLHMLVGAALLIQKALENQADVVIYDTCGLIDPTQGGLALKQAKIELLEPKFIIALQLERELEPLLIPLRGRIISQVLTMKPSAAIVRRDVFTRQNYRSASFAKYFRRSTLLPIDWTQVPVIPAPRFALGRLVALEDNRGFVVGVGIIHSINRPSHEVLVTTPLNSFDRISAIRIGDLVVDPTTYQDRQI